MRRAELRPQSRIQAVGRYQVESPHPFQEARTGFAEMEHQPSGQLGLQNLPLTDDRVHRLRTGWVMSCPLMADGPQGSLDHQWTCFQVTKARRQVGRRHSRLIPPVRQAMDLVKRGS